MLLLTTQRFFALPVCLAPSLSPTPGPHLCLLPVTEWYNFLLARNFACSCFSQQRLKECKSVSGGRWLGKVGFRSLFRFLGRGPLGDFAAEALLPG